MKKISPRKEQRVIELFKERLSVPRIAMATGLSPHSIRVIQAKFNVRATQGGIGKRTGMCARTLTALRKRISESEREIAAEFGVTNAWLKQFRRNWWRRAKKAAPQLAAPPKQLTEQPPDAVGDFFKAAELAASRAQSALQEVIGAQDFVEKFFNFEPRQGATIDNDVVKKAAGILLLLHNEFCGKPQNESAYYRQLCDGVAERLGVAQPEVGGEWIH